MTLLIQTFRTADTELPYFEQGGERLVLDFPNLIRKIEIVENH